MSFVEVLQVVFSKYLLEMLTSLIGGVSCALIGCFIILRRMALIGDALAHAILPGVVLAFIAANLWPALLLPILPLVLFIGAIITGVLTSILIGFIQKNSRTKEDSSIGIAFTFFFAVGIILISQLPKGTHFDPICFLLGDPLAVQTSDFWMMLIVGLVVLLTIIIFYRPFFAASFDPVMAMVLGINVTFVHYFMMILLSGTVVAGLRAFGVIMVVAMLIAPGLIAYQLTDRLPKMLLLSAIFGGISAVGGYILAFWQNWPTGPAITVIAGGMFFLSMLFSPRYGIVAIRFRQKKNQEHIWQEDILKSLARVAPKSLSILDLQQYMGIRIGRLCKTIRRLIRRGLIVSQNATLDPQDNLLLTENGKIEAEEILRAHRLWEKYLAESGMEPRNVHDLAEVFEHAHEMSKALNQNLGFPDKDPHGHPIPQEKK